MRSSGRRSLLIQGPSRRPSKGCAQTERPPLFEEHLYTRVERFVVQFLTQINTRLFRVFDDAVGDGQRIARDPQPAAGPGAGAAQLRLFFHHDDVQTEFSGGHRRRQAGGAGANDQNVTKQGIADVHGDYREKG